MADQLFNFYRTEFRARAVIGGTHLAITSFRLIYALDNVPEAQITLPIGRLAYGTFEKTVVDDFVERWEPFTVVEIYVHAITTEGQNAPPGKGPVTPTDEFLVFTGYLGMISAVKSVSGSAGVAVTAFGKLGGLGGATSLVRGVVSTGIADTAAFYGVPALVSEIQSKNEIFSWLAQSGFQYVGGLWKGGLQLLLGSLLKSMNIYTLQPNNFADEALKRINAGKVLKVSNLSLDMYLGLMPRLNEAITKSVYNALFNFWFAGLKTIEGVVIPQEERHLWKALVELAGEMMFYIVPAVTEDALAAITPNLGGEPYKVLDPSEYWSVGQVGKTQTDANYFNYVTSVGLYASMPMQVRNGPWLQTSSLGAASVPNDNILGKGRVLLLAAPAWLVPSPPPGAGSLGGVPDSMNPGGEAKSAFVPPEFFSVGSRVAKTYLHIELFKHRRMMLRGRFRADIAPGSLVQVNLNTSMPESHTVSLYGMVQSVLLWGGEPSGQGSAEAYTELVIANIRTELEHKELTTETHPLYQEAWRGSPLVALEE